MQRMATSTAASEPCTMDITTTIATTTTTSIVSSTKAERISLTLHTAELGGGSGTTTPTTTTRTTPPTRTTTTTTTTTSTEHTLPDVQDLTELEKFSLLTGQSVWHLAALERYKIQGIGLADGPHGVRKPVKALSLHDAYPATCFPTAAALACGWDQTVVHGVARALSVECEYYRVAVLLGPGMNLKRHAAGGRNFEYFSEDPYLTGCLAEAYIAGVQASGNVAACAKHFAVNNQEDYRFVVNAVVDERTAREMYLRQFQMIIRGGNHNHHHYNNNNNNHYDNATATTAASSPETIMCAYNRVNGTYCSEHAYLMRRILRDEWGYQGVVMTDWGATNNRAAGVAATVDLEMPGSHGVQNRVLRRALDVAASSLSSLAEDMDDNNNSSSSSRRMTEQDLENSAQRVMQLIAQHQPSTICNGNERQEDTSANATQEQQIDWKAQHKVAKEAAMECAVLLKNDDNLLPLRPNTQIALIGDFARDHPRYQGMGSSQVSTNGVLSAYDEAFRHTQHVLFATGYHYDDDHPEDVDEAALQEAIRVAQQADVAILYIGLPEIMESEGFDRTHLGLPAQHNALVHEVCRVHNNVVVVLSNGGAVELPWADEPKAILEGYLLGESGGAAIIDLIFGEQSPCGRLAETFPVAQQDILADKYFPGNQDRVEYREGLDVGYRYFDSAKVPVRFPFGHGLTYTTFEYRDLQVSMLNSTRLDVQVSVQIANTGQIEAKEVVQCYIHAADSEVYRPEQELKAFCKVKLAPGEMTRVTFRLTEDAFSFYDVGVGRWLLENGSYEIRVGKSSRDICLQSTVLVDKGESASELAKKSYPPRNGSAARVVSDEAFYGRFVTDFGSVTDEKLLESMPIFPFHRNTLLKDLAERRLFGKLLLWIVYLGASADVKPGPTAARQKRLARIVVNYLPLRTLVLFSHGGFSYELLDAILELMNYRFWSAVKKFCVAFTPFRKY